MYFNLYICNLNHSEVFKLLSATFPLFYHLDILCTNTAISLSWHWMTNLSIKIYSKKRDNKRKSSAPGELIISNPFYCHYCF